MKWTEGTVERKVVWAPGLFTVKIRCPEVKAFEPGQFLQLGLELDGTHVHRPYSVASPPGESIEFFIVTVEDGALTPYLWKLQPGDKVDVSERAAGSFTLSHCPDASVLWLIATGTGIAPYIAMLRTASPWQRYKRVVFVHGVRHGSDLAYQAELSDYAARYGNRFRYIGVVSREDKAGTLQGRITNCLANGSLENVVDQPLTADSCVMMCGNPDMLNETEKLLVSRGLKKHKAKDPGQIVVERYW
jgi:ferredoxin/flavodoxin---NADP+ reductase